MRLENRQRRDKAAVWRAREVPDSAGVQPGGELVLPVQRSENEQVQTTAGDQELEHLQTQMNIIQLFHSKFRVRHRVQDPTCVRPQLQPSEPVLSPPSRPRVLYDPERMFRVLCVVPHHQNSMSRAAPTFRRLDNPSIVGV